MSKSVCRGKEAEYSAKISPGERGGRRAIHTLLPLFSYFVGVAIEFTLADKDPIEEDESGRRQSHQRDVPNAAITCVLFIVRHDNADTVSTPGLHLFSNVICHRISATWVASFT